MKKRKMVLPIGTLIEEKHEYAKGTPLQFRWSEVKYGGINYDLSIKNPPPEMIKQKVRVTVEFLPDGEE